MHQKPEENHCEANVSQLKKPSSFNVSFQIKNHYTIIYHTKQEIQRNVMYHLIEENQIKLMHHTFVKNHTEIMYQENKKKPKFSQCIRASKKPILQ